MKRRPSGKSGLSLDEFLPYQLSVTSNAVSDLIAQAYRTLFGLRIPEWRLVAVLAEHDELSQKAMISHTDMDKITVSRAAQALLARGLIERRPNHGDGRSRLLRLSAEGNALHAQVAPKALELEANLLAGSRPDEVEQLRAMLRRLQTAAKLLRPQANPRLTAAEP